MRPLFDALADLLDDTVVNRYMERGTLEVAPLAYMRGRTLSEAFVILDEAQNATDDQLKMFLTRLGQRIEDGRDRRRHANRSSRRSAQRAPRGRRDGYATSTTWAWWSSTTTTSCAIRWWRRSFAPMIYYRNDVRAQRRRRTRAGRDGASVCSLPSASADPRSRSRSWATTRSARSTASTAGRISATDVLSFPLDDAPATAFGASGCWATS